MRLALHKQAPDLKGADLSKQDLSSRYLSHGDLRDARLTQANLFMADLSWAHLANANLSGANLAASNLSHTDLREANLDGANFLVTDLDNTILIGANLHHAHNLTPEQLRTAIYNETTQFDPEIVQAIQRKSDPQSAAPQALPAGQENTTAPERAESLIGQPDEETAEENKDAWHDTPFPQEKSVLDDNIVESSHPLESSLENNAVAHHPEGIAENA